MNLFQTDKLLNRLDQMIDNAIAGNPIEQDFDETKLSALETKLSGYLAMTQTGKQELLEEKKRINELISDISHQTKTPIANLLLYSQLLEESNLSETDKFCVNALVSQAHKLNFLIGSLMKASRLETGILTLIPKFQQVQPLLEHIVKQILNNANDKNCRIECPPTEAMAVFDYKWTAEALFNLLDNALKYSKSDHTITVSVLSYQLFCRIDIIDEGMGIPEEEIPKIFARFYRSPSVSDTEGVGIGLYLSREIIVGEGGYIKVRSKPNQGSTFSVFLPMEDKILQNC